MLYINKGWPASTGYANATTKLVPFAAHIASSCSETKFPRDARSAGVSSSRLFPPCKQRLSVNSELLAALGKCLSRKCCWRPNQLFDLKEKLLIFFVIVATLEIGQWMGLVVSPSNAEHDTANAYLHVQCATHLSTTEFDFNWLPLRTAGTIFFRVRWGHKWWAQIARRSSFLQIPLVQGRQNKAEKKKAAL